MRDAPLVPPLPLTQFHTNNGRTYNSMPNITYIKEAIVGICNRKHFKGKWDN